MEKTGRALRYIFYLLAWAVLPLFALISVPAFISCTREELHCTFGDGQVNEAEMLTSRICISDGRPITRAGGKDGWQLIGSADIFTFREDGIQALECYERLENIKSGDCISVRSSTGQKRCVILANSHLSDEDILKITRYDDLKEISVDYTYEDAMHPSMGGEVTFKAGTSSVPALTLRPFLSEIEICSLDPGDLEDICVYIVNAASSCTVLDESTAHPTGFLNQGRLRENDLSTLTDGRNLCQNLKEPKYGTVLYCYPNTVEEESAGSPFTRLIIEGDGHGFTRLYPIDIGRPGIGVERGKRYSYTISIGHDSAPFISVHPGSFITGKSGEDVHIWCEVSPPGTKVNFSMDDLEYDRERGIYDYTLDGDGKGVTLHLKKSGTGMFCLDAAEPINDGVLVIVVVN